jgi:TonB family protein
MLKISNKNHLRTFLSILAIHSFLLCSAQTDFSELEAQGNFESVLKTPNIPGQNLVWPKYKNGKSGLDKYMQENVVSPQKLAGEELTGTVILSYTISSSGKVGDIRVTSNTSDVLNQEVIKALQRSGPWIPGKKNGKYVKMKLNISFDFN